MPCVVQTNGDAKDNHSENSRSSKEAVDHQKQASIRSRSRSRSRSPGRSRSRNRSRDRRTKPEEGYRDKHRDSSAPKERGSRQESDGREARRVVQVDPQRAKDRHQSRDGRSDKDKDRHRHSRSHSHPSRHRHSDERGYSRDSADHKRRRVD